jgi:outer membrane protein assembly factor BamB
MNARYAALTLTLAIFGGAPLSAAATNWPVFGFDPSRSGFNSVDKQLTTANVHLLRERWQVSLGDATDSAPIVVQNVTVRGVSRTMLYETTRAGTTRGIDAATGAILWHFATSGPNITSSGPAADPSGKSLYAPGRNGYVYKLDAATGKPLSAPGFPLRVTRMIQTEKLATPLNVANGFLYATTSGYDGDAPPYDGHVVALRLGNGAKHVFNSLCSNWTALPGPSTCAQSDSGIWGRGGVAVDPDAAMHGRIYAATGNGDFDGNAKNGRNWGDSVIGLSADASTFAGNYTPASYASLDSGDVDLGSTSPALLPRQKASRTPLMLVQGGKDAVLRLVDRAHLPGLAHEIQQINIDGSLFSAPAVWADGTGHAWVFLGFSQEIAAYRLVTDAQGASRLAKMWNQYPGSSYGEGSSPVVANGIVFGAFDGALVALNALSGRMLWSSSMSSAGRNIGAIHWESPIVVNGWVYCADEQGRLTAYTLP